MRRSIGRAFALALLIGSPGIHPSVARATPLDIVPLDDPIEAELRALEASGAPLRIPRSGMRPLQVVDLPALDQPLTGPAEISRLRLRRALARDRGGADSVAGATRRLFQWEGVEEQRLELSLGLHGRGTIAADRDPELSSGSGVVLRIGAQTGRWLAFSDVLMGHVEGALPYTGRLFHNDAVLEGRTTFLSYTGARERWAATLGRGVWHWGPGDEGSLVLSKTAPTITAFVLRFRIEPLRADGMTLNGTLGAAGGEQLAAHRLEWQPSAGLRVGFSEAARYRASSWQPLYFVGVMPYSMVQTLTYRDEPDSGSAHRNNVIAGFDAAWRMAPGSRAYFEVVIDDLKTNRSPIVSKYGYQVGWEGMGTVKGSRLTWGVEFTRISRYVYTSFFGQAFATSGEPLGFPTGPDSRRLRVRGSWDPEVSWQVFGEATLTDRGESGLDVPFVPGTTGVDVNDFAGVVERTRDLEFGVRYWPQSGLDVAVSMGQRWWSSEDHVAGRKRSETFAGARLRWTR